MAVTKYNLFFVKDHLQQKQLDDTDGDVSNKYLLFRLLSTVVFCIFVLHYCLNNIGAVS